MTAKEFSIRLFDSVENRLALTVGFGQHDQPRNRSIKLTEIVSKVYGLIRWSTLFLSGQKVLSPGTRSWWAGVTEAIFSTVLILLV